jgi:hypothetical protein
MEKGIVLCQQLRQADSSLYQSIGISKDKEKQIKQEITLVCQK